MILSLIIHDVYFSSNCQFETTISNGNILRFSLALKNNVLASKSLNLSAARLKNLYFNFLRPSCFIFSVLNFLTLIKLVALVGRHKLVC